MREEGLVVKDAVGAVVEDVVREVVAVAVVPAGREAAARPACMHVLIVSIGCVIVPARIAPESAPIASAVFFSTPELSTRFCWMSGVMPVGERQCRT